MTDPRLIEALERKEREAREEHERLAQAARELAEVPRWLQRSEAKSAIRAGLAADELSRAKGGDDG